MIDPLLRVDGLTVDARTPQGLKRILDGISFDVAPGETLCIAGESGSGKSVTALAIMRLLQKGVLRITGGRMNFSGRDLAALPEKEMRALRGAEIAMIFQEPMTSLNPVMTIGAQLSEAIRIHQGATQSQALKRVTDMLDAVRISEPSRRLQQYPHELSGGMRQRVMIGMALSCQPKLLIADEPTTALDVTVQAQILDLMRELRGEFQTSILLITHDMGVVSEMADRVAVMQAGRIIETGPVQAVFRSPQQEYTQKLLAAVPRLGSHAGTDGPRRLSTTPTLHHETTPILSVDDLHVHYGSGTGWFSRKQPAHVVKGVSFELRRGETLGLVGESGSGKSSTGKAILGLIPFSGSVTLDGWPVATASKVEMKALRRSAQMIFQDPYASLDPRMTIGRLIEEPLIIHKLGTASERSDKVRGLLARVRLPADLAGRYPHELSGGQRQRVCIARALSLEPKLIIADESVAALDVSVRVQVLDLMQELQETMGIAYLFISHDMAVIERVSHHVAVMQNGRIVEYGPRRQIFEQPAEDYTRRLMEAVPKVL